MITKEQYNEAMESAIEWEKEVVEHNKKLMQTIKHNHKDFENLLDFANITDKIQWVDKDSFSAESQYDADKFGVFTLAFVDQWTTNMEGDSFEGYMYVEVDGYDKLLKIPYEC